MKQVLEYLEKNDKNKTAVICENESITYGELISKSKLVGTNLINKVKIKKGFSHFLSNKYIRRVKKPFLERRVNYEIIF